LLRPAINTKAGGFIRFPATPGNPHELHVRK
jgi:hypothetical protein